jgi:hypothetical protein
LTGTGNGSVNVTNSSYTGCSQANHTGTFSGGGLNLTSGVVISSGFVSSLSGGTSGSCRGSGYSALNNLSSSLGNRRQRLPTTTDASVLEIEFDCQGESDYYDVTVGYVFASNEYGGLKENETAAFNDLMGIFLNGLAPSDNIATIEGKFVSVDTIPVGSPYYVPHPDNGSPPFLAGMSVPLIARGITTKKKKNVLRIAVADVGDIVS